MNTKGIPLGEALKEFSDPSLWERFEQHRELGENRESVRKWFGEQYANVGDHFKPFIEAEKDLVSAFIGKLKSGELVATGIDRKKPFSRASRIPTVLLDVLSMNFIESSASGDGFGFAAIRISPAEGVGTVAMEARLRSWFVDKIGSGYCPAKFGTMLEDARFELGREVPERMLRRIWAAEAPPDLKKPGRKSMRRIDTPD